MRSYSLRYRCCGSLLAAVVAMVGTLALCRAQEPAKSEPAKTETAQPALEKTVTDFQGHDLSQTASETSSTFTFKSMAFTIKGRTEATPAEVVVEIDLPFAAMMFKDKAERAITKNITRALGGAV